MKNRITALLFMLACAAFSFAQTQVIAHRGYWRAPGSAQNSIKSFVLADSIGCYGSEFDVYITKDNKIVIHHDPNVKDVVIENSAYKDVLKYPLNNGERVPLLKNLIKAGKKLNTRFICEIKPHKDVKRTILCVDKTLKMFKKLSKRVTYISFSLEACKEIVNKAPAGTEVYFLGGNLTPRQLKAEKFAGADYSWGAIKKHWDWIAECHELGMKVNVWTVDDPAVMKKLVDGGVDYITTNEPVKCLQIVK